MAQGKTYYLDEALYISAKAPELTPARPGSGGGGGPGSGGQGNSTGQPGGSPPNWVNVVPWQRVFGAKQKEALANHAKRYAPLLEKLATQIQEDKVAISQQAAAEGGDHITIARRGQQLITAQLRQRRTEYLKVLPQAHDFFGAMPFFKGYDSFSSRLRDPDAFKTHPEGAAWEKQVWNSYNGSLDAAYKLHLEAEKLKALASHLPEVARLLDQAELTAKPLDLAAVITRRTAQLHLERQICFECLPNVLQHEFVKAIPPGANTGLSSALSVDMATTSSMISAKHAQVPSFKAPNPTITPPLSKPQLEALSHLVDEQASRRAGPLWADYHQALALTESIRYLEWFSGALHNLKVRAIEIERLQHQLTVEQAAADEAARQKKEADRIAAETELPQQETLRQNITYFNGGKLAGSAPTVVPIGAATFAIAEAGYAALKAAIAEAVAGMVAASVPSLAVGTLAMAWPSTLGNSERQYLISTPLASLTPADGPDLAALAASSTSIDLPYLMAGVENEGTLDLYVVPGGKPIAVRAATFDSERQVYSLALDNPQRILTWTPASAPGGEGGSSTSLPPAPPGTVVYTGSSLNPVRNEPEGYPALDLLDQERLIITFPLDSGLPPILVVFKSRRYETGTSIGAGAKVTDTWHRDAASPEGAPVPAQIADLLRGIEFKSFDAFRRQFWKAVANDPELSKQFKEMDLIRMKKNGYSPTVDFPDSYMSQKTFVLHHLIPISEGGGVYDMDNIRIVTPLSHNKIHYGTKP